jgi:uncharacterized protein YceH (UPF0502 family)
MINERIPQTEELLQLQGPKISHYCHTYCKMPFWRLVHVQFEASLVLLTLNRGAKAPEGANMRFRRAFERQNASESKLKFVDRHLRFPFCHNFSMRSKY